MDNVIKFPKSKVNLMNKIYSAYDEADYRKVVSFKSEVLEYYADLKSEDIFEIILESYFELSAFEEVITFGDELIKQGYEDFELYFYMLASYIAIVDIYQAKSLIRRSKILNQDDIKFYYSNEGANYTNILNLSDEIFELAAPCLLLVNFITEVSKEIAGDFEVDHEYLLYRFFDLINLVYELGYEYEIIHKLDRVIKIVFGIEI
jgi:hypothetical protein